MGQTLYFLGKNNVSLATVGDLTTSFAFPFKIDLDRFNLMPPDPSNISDKGRVVI